MRIKGRGKLAVAAVVLALVGACAAGPEVVKLAGGQSVAGTVTFMHARHTNVGSDGYGLGCDKCHHMVLGAKKVSRRCRDCHKRGGEQPVSMEQAAHTLCTGCHDEVSKQDPAKKLPASCPDCHVLDLEGR